MEPKFKFMKLMIKKVAAPVLLRIYIYNMATEVPSRNTETSVIPLGGSWMMTSQ